jgi:PAS domain S-box-containing protein
MTTTPAEQHENHRKSPNDDFYNAALKHLPIYIFAQDKDLRYTAFIAPSMTNQPTMVGKTDHEVFTKADAEHLTHYKRYVLRTGRSQHLGIDLDFSGMHRVFDLTLEPLRNEHGNINGLAGAAMDITAQVKAKQTLEEANIRLRSTLESITNAYIAVDFEMRILQINSIAENSLFHQPAERVIGHNLWEFISEKPGPSLYQIYLDTLRKGESTQFEYQTNDKAQWWELHAYPHTDRVDLFLRDITIRKSADQLREQLMAQLESEGATLQALVNNAPEGIAMADHAGHTLVINPAAQRLYTRPISPGPPDESTANPQFSTPDGKLLGLNEHPLAHSALFGVMHVNEEMCMRWPDGQHRDLLVNTAPVFDSHGNISGAVGVMQDITERKATEQALQTNLAYVQELYNTTRSIGLAQIPEDVLHVLVNTSYLKGCQYAMAGVFNKTWRNGDDPPESWRVIAVNSVAEMPLQVLGKEYKLDQRWLVTANIGQQPFCAADISTEPTRGDVKWTLATALNARSLITLPLITGGACYGLLCFYYDHTSCLTADDARHVRGLADQAATAIHNMRLLEAEARARQEAEQANDLRLRFLAMISHELRTPLTSIKGFASTLLAEDVSWDASTQHDFIKTIDQEADKLTDMIDQLLDLSRLESGTLRIDPLPVMVSDLLINVRSQLDTLTQNHILNVQIPEVLPSVRADRQRIAQVLGNLVSNAAKYSPAGSTITITAHHAGLFIVFAVTDQGMGISPADQARLFTPFQRGSDMRAQRIKGAGLGLTICKGLVETHGGRIWVEHSDPSGTTISFTLPVA